MWSAALDGSPQLVGITSFNEWHEGTNIEPVANHNDYPNFDGGPFEFLDRTRHWVDQMKNEK